MSDMRTLIQEGLAKYNCLNCKFYSGDLHAGICCHPVVVCNNNIVYPFNSCELFSFGETMKTNKLIKANKTVLLHEDDQLVIGKHSISIACVERLLDELAFLRINTDSICIDEETSTMLIQWKMRKKIKNELLATSAKCVCGE